MLAAEAKKAYGANKAALRIPNSPSLTGKLAYTHSTSVISTFRNFDRPDSRVPSNISKPVVIRAICHPISKLYLTVLRYNTILMTDEHTFNMKYRSCSPTYNVCSAFGYCAR